MARKRSTNCAANGRNSPGQRLGVKAWGGEIIPTGAIILRQKGTRFFPGMGVRMGRDHTLYAGTQGKVAFGWSQDGRRTVSIVS